MESQAALPGLKLIIVKAAIKYTKKIGVSIDDAVPGHVQAKGIREASNFCPPPTPVQTDYNGKYCLITGEDLCGKNDCHCDSFKPKYNS